MMRLLIVALLLAPVSASADVLPRPGPGDPHIQTVDYDADQLVTLRVATGYTVTIQFSPDERIENVAVGNSAAWQAMPNRRADHLFVKPVQPGVTTNMTVITEVRRYNFRLVPADGLEPDLPFTVSFRYPGIDRAPDVVVEPNITVYALGGEKSLWPSAMSDDGTFTSIVWEPDVTMPAVYKVNARGKEEIVNGIVRDGVYVVEGIAERFVFRLGKAVAVARRKEGE
ncbi:TrbG/VirB9 family P-type conjugative transfer protein [Erythrobacter colymbi]|uniref:TrbG/VirB9 family P-type conjugative transfer protein n=1 Tax=Erythrobacter colymbi TaxID=1161202 RepID=UPI001F0A66F6|nr:TrbG/VirB9 family P-type conjugative transfer protein [Erythrobacter colymbi]